MSDATSRTNLVANGRFLGSATKKLRKNFLNTNGCSLAHGSKASSMEMLPIAANE